jgi:serine/threonine protein kinase/WD40 repeat protein
MPSWNPRANEIFADAIDIGDAAARARFVDQACGGDEEIRQKVEALLRAHLQAGSFLEGPAPQDLQATADHSPRPAAATIYAPSRTDVVGTIIAGRYKLLEEIGSGGMGTVWMAEQREPVKRLVALKLIKPGMDSRAVLARFEAERQALAIMDHPNIAKVLDGGTTEQGRPFFAMELVKGLPITEYCDSRRIAVSQRLELFAQVCNAVQHAHQKGIIHRDIKPSNVLITEHDGQPVPKVIDFGLAKALNASTMLTDRTLHTAFGMVVGTPLYMAPEQVGLNALDVDTRADIYSLGVILYELLTGTTPLEKQRFKEAAWQEVQRLIREEEPPRPSSRLSSQSNTDVSRAGDGTRRVPTTTLASIAAQRHTEPARLTKMIRGDLDWIVLKALEKDRNRRYETANGLAADLRRHIAGEPVLAAPPSPAYRMRKLMRKHRRSAIAATLILTALLAGIIGTTWGLIRAEGQRRIAVVEKKRAEQAQKAEEVQRIESDRRGDALAKSSRRNQLAAYASSTQLAQREWELGNIARVRDLLHEMEPSAGQDDLRGFEWNYLKRQCDATALTLTLPSDLVDPRTRVTRVEFSTDGSRLIAVAHGQLLAWQLPGGQPVTLLRNVTRSIEDARLSPDGRWLAALAIDQPPDQYRALGAEDNKKAFLEIWNLADGIRVHSTELSTAIEGRVAIRPDGRQVAVHVIDVTPAYYVNTVVLVDPSTGLKQRQLYRGSVPGRLFEFLTYSHDGTLLVAPGEEHQATLYDAESGESKGVIDLGNVIVRDGEFSVDDRRVAFADDSGRITIWSVPDGTAVQTLRAGDQNAHCVRFSPDGNDLASLAGSNVRIWDARTGEYRRLIRGASNCLAYGPDGGRIAAAGDASTIRAWDAHAEQGALVHAGEVSSYSVAFSPDGKSVIRDSGLLLDSSTGVDIKTFSHRPQELWTAVTFHPDTERPRLMVSSSAKPDPAGQPLPYNEPGDLVLLDVSTGEELQRVEGIPNASFLRFSPNGRWLAARHFTTKEFVPNSGAATLVDTTTWKTVLSVPEQGHARCNFAFAPDSNRLAVSRLGHVAVLEVPSGRELRRFGDFGVSAGAVAWSPDGRLVAAAPLPEGPSGHVIRIWDAETAGETHVIPLTAGESIQALSFSPDGRRLASAGFDAKIRIWDTESGLELLTLVGHTHWIWGMSFSADGNRIVSSSGDKTVRIWDGSPVVSGTGTPP